MMKKFLTITIFSAAIISLFMSCNARRQQLGGHLTYDEGVVIDGVRWATRNVDAPGTFAANPEDAGMFYQWNRQRGWMSRGENVFGWPSSTPSGTVWARGYDPCPPGWRVPTYVELRSLVGSGSVWTTQNGINGRLFGTAPNQIFLPAAGWRDHHSGSHSRIVYGFYWSSEQNTPQLALLLRFSNINAFMNTYERARGHSVRCVADDN